MKRIEPLIESMRDIAIEAPDVHPGLLCLIQSPTGGICLRWIEAVYHRNRMSKVAKNVWTFLIAGTVAVLIPVCVTMILRRGMGKMLTDDNASILFAEFGSAIHEGNIVHDPVTAAAVAREAYLKKTAGILVDGWARPMHIYAILNGSNCELHVQSAGPDGNFGNADDLDYQQTFDLSGAKSPATTGQG